MGLKCCRLSIRDFVDQFLIDFSDVALFPILNDVFHLLMVGRSPQFVRFGKWHSVLQLLLVGLRVGLLGYHVARVEG